MVEQKVGQREQQLVVKWAVWLVELMENVLVVCLVGELVDQMVDWKVVALVGEKAEQLAGEKVELMAVWMESMRVVLLVELLGQHLAALLGLMLVV